VPDGASTGSGHGARRFAVAPPTVAVLALLIAWSPQTAGVLEFDRARLLHGELWRALTAHLTHWSGPHLLTNAAGACLLGAWFRTLDTRFWIVAGSAAALAIAAGLLLEAQPLDRYRGLSGVLYGWLVAALFVDARHLRSNTRRHLQQACGLAVPLWALADLAGLTAPLRAGTVPVHAAAHLYGIVGACIGAWCLVRFSPAASARSRAGCG
jgi:rhomboid family GlyGly-CTERM serine protease